MVENKMKEPEELDTQMSIECSGCSETVYQCDNCHESEGIDCPGKVVHLEVTEWEFKHFCSMDCAEQWIQENGDLVKHIIDKQKEVS